MSGTSAISCCVTAVTVSSVSFASCGSTILGWRYCVATLGFLRSCMPLGGKSSGSPSGLKGSLRGEAQPLRLRSAWRSSSLCLSLSPLGSDWTLSSERPCVARNSNVGYMR